MTDLVPTEDQKINWSISAALREGRFDDARELLLRHPQKRQNTGLMHRWCFSNAQNGRLRTVTFLLTEYGLDINHEEPINKNEPDTMLQQAVHSGNHDLVEWLLKNGANPNVGRPIIGAINIRNDGSEADAVSMIRLLAEYGCDLNRHYPLMGDENDTFTALDWAGSNTLAFDVLRTLGAKSTDELPK